jgi:hypothetical protein
MISLYRYWYAKKRLKQSFETLSLMAPSVPPLVEAQHEMICCEVNYYKHRIQKFAIIWLTLILIVVIMFTLYAKGYINV